MANQSPILDHTGTPFQRSMSAAPEVARLRAENQRLKASYDANADGDSLVNYYANADNLSPNAANSSNVRRRLRMRSRYEIIENNPYLQGTILTICNDFVGSGPKLQVVDPRLGEEARRYIERSWHRWAKLTKYRQQLWRSRMAKIVDGESFRIAYTDRSLNHPVKLNYFMVEADQCTSVGLFNTPKSENEVDGVRFDQYGNPTHYHILDQHPGGLFPSTKGQWVPAQFVRHWFRKTRGWLRAIPELTPSLAKCAYLRRYTIAVVLAAESAADLNVVLQSQLPPGAGYDEQSTSDWFQSFPIEKGMMTALPWGYTMSQIDSKQPIQTYDSFTQALLLEIIRPLMTPYNLAAGTSKDANMSSAVVDTHIYKEGQKQERIHCEEEQIEPDYELWWQEFVKTADFEEAPELAGAIQENPSLLMEPAQGVWRWDEIGLEHTDPQKVWNAITTAHKEGHLTDRDIQEGRFNRDVNDWRRDVENQVAWRKKVFGDSQPQGNNQPNQPQDQEDE